MRSPRPHGRLFSCSLVSSLCIVALLASPARAVSQDIGVWTLKETAAGPHDEMFGIGAVSENDVWVVGRTDNGSTLTLWSEHWDGLAWSVVPVPQEPDLPYAFLGQAAAVSANDVWATGTADDGGQTTRGLLRHWDGTAWTSSAVPNPGAWSEFQGMAFPSSTDGWMVGATSSDHTGRPVAAILDHWGGNAWSEATLPEGMCGGGESYLYDVDAVDAVDAWAVGSCGDNPMSPLLLHWDGQAWTQVVADDPPGADNPFFDGVSAIASNEVWAVGSKGGAEPLIEHWDGNAWTSVSSSSQGDISGLARIAGVSSGDLWAVGFQLGNQQLPLIEHWDGAAWTPVDGVNPFGDNQTLGEIVALPNGVVWTVGYSLFEEMIESDVGDGGFSAPDTNGRLGSAQAWSFPGGNLQSHSVIDSTGCGLFDSGLRAGDDSFLFPFKAAGTYLVKDSQTQAKETVAVRMLAALKNGKISARWATAAPNPGFVFDMQARPPGSSTWFTLKRGVTTQAALLTPPNPGTYGFRARLRNPGVPCASGWSPAVQVTV
jgi:hypothetical protein